MLVMILIIFLVPIIKWRQLKLIVKLDEGVISPSDYTLIVKGIPLKDFSKSRFWNFINVKNNAVKVNYAFHIGEYVELSRKIGKWKDKKRILEIYRKELLKENPNRQVDELYPDTKCLCYKCNLKLNFLKLIF